MRLDILSYSKIRNWIVVGVCVAILASPAGSNAQSAGTGSIQGSITDSTGAIIQNATVTATNVATQVKQIAITEGNGHYSLPNLAIGTYTLDVVAPGFEHYSQSKIVLEVGSSISVNVGMTVGRTDQKVEVQASGLALQTEDASFKQTIDQQTVTEMPLNGRQMTGLIALSGGSTPAPGGDFTGSKYSYQVISVSIAGGMGNTTMWRLDGGTNNDYMANGNLPFPFPDAVSQFSVESTALSAQDGMHTGGLVNVVTRSGTNKYHGSAFEFIRNNYINASNFFSATKDTLHQNQFGGTFGGPILRDKLFAFAGYQRSVSNQSQAATQAFVPTAANLAGDWSVTDGPTCTSNKSTIALVDPLTGTKLVGNKYPSQPTYNPQSLKLMSYLPKIDPAIDTAQLRSCQIRYSIADHRITSLSPVWTGRSTRRTTFTAGTFSTATRLRRFFSPTNILITTQIWKQPAGTVLHHG